MIVNNIFATESLSLPEDKEFFESLCEGNNLKIERIVSRGQVSPPGKWYEQPENEWVILLKGKATLEFEKNKMAHLSAGDYLLLPAGLRHRVAFTSKDPECVWLAIHFK